MRANVAPYSCRVNPTGRRSKPPSEPGGGHALTGGGPSQLGVDSSMRARDVSQPTDTDLENAEATVKVTRRSPPAPSPAG